MKQARRLIMTVGLAMLLLCLLNVSALAQETNRFPEGVIEVPQGTAVSIDDDAGTVTIANCPASIEAGDTFIVYLQDLPIGYTAQAITASGDSLIISAEKADKSVYALLDEEGVVELTPDMYEFIPAEDVSYSIASASGPSFNIVDRLKYEDGKLTVTVAKAGDRKIEVKISKLSLSHSFTGGKISLGLKGDWEISMSSKEDSLGEVPLGEIRIFGIGKIALSINVTHSLKATFAGTFNIGFNVEDEGNNQATKKLSVTRTSVEEKGEVSVSLKFMAGIDILVVEADAYGEVGITTHYKTKSTYHPETDPPKTVQCDDYKIYFFVNAGLEAQYTKSKEKKKIGSIDFKLLDDDNSPYMLDVHFENGKHVSSCSEGMDTTSIEASYGGLRYSFGSTLGSDGRDRILSADVYLPWDVETDGDYSVSSYGNLNLNGHTLTVNGDLIHSGGTLTVSNGTLIVNGNYRIQNGTEDAYGDSNGSLVMNNSAGTVRIAGDFIVQTNATAQTMTAGTIYLDGNLYQRNAAKNQANFNTGTGLNIVLTANKSHAIQFENSDENNIGWLSLENDVTILNSIRIGILDNNGHDVIVNGNLTSTRSIDMFDYDPRAEITDMGNLTLQSAMTVQSVPLFHDIDLSGHQLTINGDMISSGNVDLNSGVLTVHGNLYHYSGTISIDEGLLDIKGSYYNIGSNSVLGGEKENIVYSSGHLNMSYSTDEMRVAGDFMISSQYASTLTAGTLYVGGDFRQVGTSTSNYSPYRGNFVATKDHKTVLNGTGTQTIRFASSSSGFGTLEAANDQLIFGSNINWLIQASDIHATADSVSLSERSIDLNGKTLTIDGSVTVYSSIDINGGTFSVSGDITHINNTITLNNGKLLVGGAYRMIGSNSVLGGEKENIVYSSGHLNMSYSTDEMRVAGDFMISSQYASTLTAGTLYVGGDFRQVGTSTSNYSPYRGNFVATKDHKTVLNGTGTQTIRFASSSSGFGTLEAANDQLIFGSNINWLIQASDIHATADSVSLSERSIDLNGKTLTIDGSVTVYSSIDINGGTFSVSGDITHINNTITLNNGKLLVGGAYRMIGSDSVLGGEKENITYSTGYLDMSYTTDEMRVAGDFVIASQHASTLTAGTLYVGGDFRQVGTYSSSNHGYTYSGNFAAGEGHRTILNGSQEQTIRFASSSSGFGTLESTNDQLFFADKVNWLIQESDIHATADSVSLSARSIDLNGKSLTVGGSVTISSPININNGALYIIGSATINASIDINNGFFTVSGDITHINGTITINCGKMTVGGAYRMIGRDSVLGGEKENIVYSSGQLNMSYSTDEMRVAGDFVIASQHASTLTAGTLYVGGDFRQVGTIGRNNYSQSFRENFVATKDHKTVLNGTGAQTIRFASGYSGFGTLEATNDQLIFDSNINWLIQASDIHATADSVSLSERSIDLNGKTLTIDGNVTVYSSIDINGGTFSVSGDITHIDGTITLNSGKLLVGGAYRMIGSGSVLEGEKENITYSNGQLDMSYTTDEMRVAGDFMISSQHASTLTAGTLYVGGDFRQVGTYSPSNHGYTYSGNFAAGEGHRTILNGSQEQTIRFASSSSGFGTLESTNDQLIFGSNINWLIQASDIHATADDAWLTQRSIDLNGKTLTIDGSVTVYSSIDINGGTFSVSGDITHINNTITLNNGKLLVGGAYRMIGSDSVLGGEKENITYSTGYLDMSYTTDEMRVAGDFMIASRFASTLTNGTLYVGGDFRQVGTSSSTSNSAPYRGNFAAGTGHRTVLNGAGKKNISFASTASHFGTLEITQLIPLYAFSYDKCWLALIEPEMPVFGSPDFILPSMLTEIDEFAFEGIAATIVYIPDTCGSIGDYAFSEAAITQIRVPENCEIADTAFEGCGVVLIFGAAGSAAEAFCEAHDNCVFISQ